SLVLVAHLGAQVDFQPDDHVAGVVAQGLDVEGIPALLEVGQEHRVIDVTQGVDVTPPHLDRLLEYRGHMPTSLGSTQKLSPVAGAAREAVAGRGTTGTSRPWPQPERHESPGLPAEELIFAGIDADGFGDRPRFQQALDEEPGREDLLAGGFQRCQPVPHLPAPAPALLNGPDLEIAAAVVQPVAGR